MTIMVFTRPSVLVAALLGAFALLATQQGPAVAEACRCAEEPDLCDPLQSDIDILLRGTPLTRVEGPTINGDVTYTAEVVELYHGEIEDSLLSSEHSTDGVVVITFLTAGSTAACGVQLDIGPPPVDYLLHLYYDDVEEVLRTSICGLTKDWSLVTRSEEAILTLWPRGCSRALDDDILIPVPIGGDDDEPVCDPPCGEFQECYFHLNSGDAEENYCVDVCRPSPCAEDETCHLQYYDCVHAIGIRPCLPSAICTPKGD